jgi:putative hydrolase of the HAD superfamily
MGRRRGKGENGLMSARSIELVTFDLYDTLIELHPTRWVRLHAALAKLGIESNLDELSEADVAAEDFYTSENAITPIRDRPVNEQAVFRLNHMRVWLAAAGVAHDDETLAKIRALYVAEFESPAVETTIGFGYRVFADVIPTMRALRAAGVKTAVISNADADVTNLCLHFAFAQEMDLIVTSALVGWEKPDVRTYRAALDPLGVEPERALHIGDQPRSDVVGALAAGMRAALIDRYARHTQANHDVPLFRDFSQLVRYIEAVNSDDLVARS